MTDPATDPMAHAIAEAVPDKPPRSQWWDVWDQFKSHRGALMGSGFGNGTLGLFALRRFGWIV